MGWPLQQGPGRPGLGASLPLGVVLVSVRLEPEPGALGPGLLGLEPGLEPVLQEPPRLAAEH